MKEKLFDYSIYAFGIVTVIWTLSICLTTLVR